MAWAVGHRSDNGMNIRVLNLSLGFRPESAYVNDVLSFAVEQTWKYGVTVVVSAGNTGATTTGLDSPAYDPYVIAVGADDLDGTPDVADDAVSAWSSRAARRPRTRRGRPRARRRQPPRAGLVPRRQPPGRPRERHAVPRQRHFAGRGRRVRCRGGPDRQAPVADARPGEGAAHGHRRRHPGVDATAQGAGRIDVAAAAAAAAPYGAKRPSRRRRSRRTT